MPRPPDLTLEQTAAAEATEAKVLVSAGPGTGKTLVLAARIAHLIYDRAVDPQEILALTFTRSAAAGIRARVSAVVGAALAEAVTIETFHAFAARSTLPRGTRVATPAEEEAALRGMVGSGTRRPAGPTLTAYKTAIRAHDARGEDLGVAAPIVQRLLAAGLYPTWALVSYYEQPDRGYRHVLIDEAQDCTPMETRLAFLSCSGDRFAVGDPRQAIMGWRGATGVRWAPTRTYALTRTFRFGGRLTERANAIAAAASTEPPIIGAPDVATEVDLLPDLDCAIMDADLGCTAVLCRTNIEAEAIGAHLGARARVCRRDPLDPFSSEADVIAETWAMGRAVVATIHSFKGREAEHVILARDLVGRHRSSEEHRVTYVGMTRARLRLSIIPELPA